MNFNVEDYDCPILDAKYALIKTIGSGATCKVKLAKEIQTGKTVAVKILKTGTNLNSNEKVFKSEIETLKKINHPNIINIKDGAKGFVKKPNETQKMVDYIVLEMAEYGELFDFLYFPRKGFGEDYGRYLFKQLIEGIEACHKAGVAHRDLKTENIMLSEDWGLKIADFGYATLLEGKLGTGKLTTYLGTLSYAAPEILSKQPYYGSCADLFSCGVILFVLVTGKLPYGKAVVHDSYYRNFVNNDYEGFWNMMGPKIGNVSDEFKSLVTLLLSYDAAQRPTINEIKSHPWLTGKCISPNEMKAEFEKRKVIVLQQRKIEANKKEMQKKVTSNNSTRVVRTGIYKGSKENGGEMEVDFQEELELNLKRDIGCFIDTQSPYTVMTNLNEPDELFIAIYRFFMEKDSVKKQIKINKNNFSLEVNYVLDEETLKQLEGIDVESLKVKVELKRNDNDEIVIEFKKLQGDKGDFYEVFDSFTNTQELKF